MSADIDDEPDALCEACGDGMDATEVNVESFELTGKLLCPDCADEAMEKA